MVMKKYVCSICGYVYDEAKGMPEAGIKPGTKWEELPQGWVCPLCGAAKSDFKEQSAPTAAKPAQTVGSSDLKALSALEISALCSNLAKGCEKQYMSQQAAQWRELAAYYQANAAPAQEPSCQKLLDLVQNDLESGFVNANAAAGEANDRGAKRALVWSEKVTRILNALLARYAAQGEEMIASTNVYVCTICGFVYVGDQPPELCPVCKVPSWKFEKLEGR